MNPLSLPWYRYPFVWLVLGLPATAVIAGICTLILAIRSEDGLVEDDYYQQGKEINLDQRRDQAANRLGLSAQILLGEDRRSLRIILNQPVDSPLQLKIRHITQSGLDQQVLLQRQSNRMWIATLAQPLELPTWQVQLADTQGNWRLHKRWNLSVQGGNALLLETSSQ